MLFFFEKKNSGYNFTKFYLYIPRQKPQLHQNRRMSQKILMKQFPSTHPLLLSFWRTRRSCTTAVVTMFIIRTPSRRNLMILKHLYKKDFMNSTTMCKRQNPSSTFRTDVVMQHHGPRIKLTLPLQDLGKKMFASTLT